MPKKTERQKTQSTGGKKSRRLKISQEAVKDLEVSEVQAARVSQSSPWVQILFSEASPPGAGPAILCW